MKSMKLSSLLLCLWLIGAGLIQILGLHFNGIEYVMGGLAIAAGVLGLVGR